MTFDEWFHKEYEPADLQIKQYAERKEGLHIPATVYIDDLKKAFEAGQKGKVVEHFEAYGQCRDSRRIAELEKENERLTVSYETLKLHDEEEIGMLKSENAELKTNFEVLSCSVGDFGELQEKLEEEQRKNNGLSDNLTKAKELLKRYVPYRQIIDSKAYKDLAEEAEQFLSEVEK